MKKNLLRSFLSIIFIAISSVAYSQTGGVSINKTNAPADASAMLDVSSSSAPYLGMLIPRMNTTNRNTIITPAAGLMIYNTDCGVNEYYTGTCWVSMGQNLKAPDPITCSGTTDFCANETRTFTIPAVNGATGYQWTEPSGATIISGQGTTSVTIAFGNNSGEVCVTAGSLCETSPARCKSIHINPVPLVPGNITGPTIVAPGTAASYFIAAVAGAGLYNWTVPAGATITSGMGTTAITVSFSCSAVSGNVAVTAQNNCGASAASTLAITLTPVIANAGSIIASPGTLGGSPTASGGTSPYTYVWVPSTNLSSTTVANPTTTVCTTITYTVTVTDANGCSVSSSVITSVTNPIPATPGPISGNTNISCNSLSGNVYSISPVSGATTYTWTVPSGATITAGQNTSSITVNFAFTSGDITVTAGNNCGTSSANTLAVTVPSGGGSGTQTLSYTGGQQVFTVPGCVTSITVDAYGASGGLNDWNTSFSWGPPGKGGRVQATLAVSGGTVIYVYVGGAGANGIPNSITAGGFNGGGSAAASSSHSGGGGGGASDLRIGGSTLNDRVLVAGGAGGICQGGGGQGGGLTGGDGGNGGGGQGFGGTQSAGGNGGTYSGCGCPQSGSGSLGTGGNDVFCSGCGGYSGGGGGGGYYGGGAGSIDGGGGGSSYVSSSIGTNITHTQGVRTGNGEITISW